MKYSGALQALRVFSGDVHLVPFLWGGSAIGKTALVESVGALTARTVIPLHLYTQDHGDLLGAMEIRDGKTHWAKPSWWPEADDTILFLDELNVVRDETIKAAANQLIHERRLHVHQLPPGTMVVGAGNPEGMGYGVSAMLRPQLTRLCHLFVQPDAEDWLQWADAHACFDQVMAFIAANPKRLYEVRDEQVDLSELRGRPRCWESVSRFMKAGGQELEDDLLLEVLSGIVGVSAARDFLDHCQDPTSKKNGVAEWIADGKPDRAFAILKDTRDRLFEEPNERNLDTLLSQLRQAPREMRTSVLSQTLADHRVAQLANSRLAEIRALQSNG